MTCRTLQRMNCPTASTASTVRRATLRLGRRLRAERPADGPSITQLALLAHLHDMGALTSGELAMITRTTPQALTRPLASLAVAGLLERQPHPSDGRQHTLTILPAGVSALAASAAPQDAWLDGAMHELLTPAEREILVVAAGLLTRLAEHGARP